MSPRFIQVGLLSLLSSAFAAPLAPQDGLSPRQAPYEAGNATACGGPTAVGTGLYRRDGQVMEAIPTSGRAACDSTSTVIATTTSFTTLYVKRARPTYNPVAGTTAAAAPVTSVSPASTSPASGSTSSTSNGKKAGVAYNLASAVSPFVGKSNIGWAYNWNASPGSISGVEYLPLLWGSQSVYTNTWVSDANAAISKGATAVLGFNEPDHAEQANLDYNTAATLYKQYITDNFAGKAKLVSPAVTNGGGAMGLTYLQNFMKACSDCKIDAVAIHWYDSSSNIDYFKSHIQQANTMFGLPVYLTEFGTTDGNDQAFLEAVQPWLDSQSYVEKYAYFMAESGKLLSGSSLSAAGATYAGA